MIAGRRSVPLALCILTFGAVGCASGRRVGTIQRTPSPVARVAAGRPSHIAMIVMENEEYGDVIGSPQAPFINRLARSSALATTLFAISHPSLPNYLALTAGSTFGINSDCTDCSVAATSIVDQLGRARLSWKAYMEGVPHPCFSGSSSAGDYAKKHDPFMYYTRVAHDRKRCAKVVALSALYRDERARALPDFLWITPNLCHDMHDCSVATGDGFLATLVPGLLQALGPRGLLILTWDEGTSDDGCCRLASGGRVATILAGGLARAGARLRTPADHYSTLQLIDDLLALPRLRGAGCACTPSLQRLVR